jgi:hypothetical protein
MLTFSSQVANPVLGHDRPGPTNQIVSDYVDIARDSVKQGRNNPTTTTRRDKMIRDTVSVSVYQDMATTSHSGSVGCGDVRGPATPPRIWWREIIGGNCDGGVRKKKVDIEIDMRRASGKPQGNLKGGRNYS